MLEGILLFFSLMFWGMAPVVIVVLLMPLVGQIFLWLVIAPLYILFYLAWQLCKLAFWGMIVLVIYPFARLSTHAPDSGHLPATPALPKGKNP